MIRKLSGARPRRLSKDYNFMERKYTDNDPEMQLNQRIDKVFSEFAEGQRIIKLSVIDKALKSIYTLL